MPHRRRKHASDHAKRVMMDDYGERNLALSEIIDQ